MALKDFDLPEKINITAAVAAHGVKHATELPKDNAEYIAWKAYYDERARRRDPSQDGVAKEALACMEELVALNRSPSEADTVYGYSLPRTLKKAMREEKRLIKELQANPSKDVAESAEVCLKKADVMAKHGIKEYVKPVEPEVEPKGEVTEPVVVEK